MGHLALLLALDPDLYLPWAALLATGRTTHYGPLYFLWATLHFSLLSTMTSTHYGPHYLLWAALLTMGRTTHYGPPCTSPCSRPRPLLTLGRTTHYGPLYSLWATLHFSLLSTMTSCCTIMPGPARRCTIFFSFGQAPHSL